MKETNQNCIIDIGTATVLTAGLIFSMANYTLAAGTPSGTSVGNIATINYDVNGTSQPPIGSTEGGNTSGAGTETTFLVGTTINLTLVETNTTYTSAATGSLLQATGFTLTNLGNNSHGYNLTAAN
jgi:hypothetical protein